MPRLRLLTLALAAFAAAAITAFASMTTHAQTIDDIVRRGRVIIAVDTSNPPWGFLDRAGQAILAARRESLRTGVMLLDLDRFKEVNDTLGHHNGDNARGW